MIKRHDIDKHLLKFIMENFNKNCEDKYNSFESSSEKISIMVYKHSLTLDKVTVFIHTIIGKNMKKRRGLEFSHDFSQENSSILYKFFQDIEDKSNQDFLRNEHERILNIISD